MILYKFELNSSKNVTTNKFNKIQHYINCKFQSNEGDTNIFQTNTRKNQKKLEKIG